MYACVLRAGAIYLCGGEEHITMIHQLTNRAISKLHNALAVPDIVQPRALVHVAIRVHVRAASVLFVIHKVAFIHLLTVFHEQYPLAVMTIAMPHTGVDVAIGIYHVAYAVFLILVPLTGVYARPLGIPTLAVALSHAAD